MEALPGEAQGAGTRLGLLLEVRAHVLHGLGAVLELLDDVVHVEGLGGLVPVPGHHLEGLGEHPRVGLKSADVDAALFDVAAEVAPLREAHAPGHENHGLAMSTAYLTSNG